MEKTTQKTKTTSSLEKSEQKNPSLQRESIGDQISIEVEKINKSLSEEIIGGNWTYLAVKNSTSYMIGTERKGLQIIDDSEEVYSASITDVEGALLELVYINHMNCYLMHNNLKLYKKDIDCKPPYLFMDIYCGWKEGASLRYSKINQRLLINIDWKNIAVINLERKQVEVEPKRAVGELICDFRIFGKKESRVLALTTDAYILLYHFNYQLRKIGARNSFKIELKQERNEHGSSIAVSDKGEYALVEIGSKMGNIASRMVILKIETNQLQIRTIIEIFSHELGTKYGLECAGYAGCHILWVGLTSNGDGIAQIYDYDTQIGQLKELVSKRRGQQGSCLHQIHRLGNEIFYTGRHGRVLRLSLTSSN